MNPPAERASVAVRCPTCAGIAETWVVGTASVPWPMPRELIRLHADCDLLALYRELSTSARLLYPLSKEVWP